MGSSVKTTIEMLKMYVNNECSISESFSYLKLNTFLFILHALGQYHN